MERKEKKTNCRVPSFILISIVLDEMCAFIGIAGLRQMKLCCFAATVELSRICFATLCV